MRGLLAVGAYVPYARLDRRSIAEALGVPAGSGTRVVASYDEDTTSMGVEAVSARRLDAAWRPGPAPEAWLRFPVEEQPVRATRPLLVLLQRLNRLTSRDPPDDRDAHHRWPDGRPLPNEPQPARDLAVALDQTAPFEGPQVVVHHRRRRDADRLADLADARRVAVIVGVLPEEVQNPLLSL